MPNKNLPTLLTVLFFALFTSFTPITRSEAREAQPAKEAEEVENFREQEDEIEKEREEENERDYDREGDEAEDSDPTPKPTIKPVQTARPIFASSPKPTSSPIPTLKPIQTASPKPLVTTTPKPSATPTTADLTYLQKQDYIIKEINAYRASNGLSPIKKDPYTCGFAKTRSQEITTDFSHSGFRERINNRSLPYPGYSLITENIAMTSDYKRVVPMWINSSGHALNMRRDTPFVCVEFTGRYFAYEGWKP